MMNPDVQVIQQMLDSRLFDSTKMEDVLSHYQDHPAIIPCTILKGAKIIRSSSNNAHKFHDDVSRLSYPPKEFARTDRASLKGKPMFYGTVPTSAIKQNAHPLIISALETTDILRDFNQEGRVFTTQSIWSPNRDLHLFAFPFSRKYKRACEEIKGQRDFWDTQLSLFWPKHFCEFSQYIGELIAQVHDSCLYDITATVIDFILYKSTAAADLDGVMYPSVWGDGEGMNVCLKKETVDDCVVFQTATVQCIEKIVGKCTIFGVAESSFLPGKGLIWTPTKAAISILEKAYGAKTMFDRDMVIFEKQTK